MKGLLSAGMAYQGAHGRDVAFNASLTPPDDDQVEWGSGIFVAKRAVPDRPADLDGNVTDSSRVNGESIGMMKFNESGAEVFSRKVETLMRQGDGLIEPGGQLRFDFEDAPSGLAIGDGVASHSQRLAA